jgi:hypothetical protein
VAPEGFDHAGVEAFDGFKDANGGGEFRQALTGVDAEADGGEEDEQAPGHAGGDKGGGGYLEYVGEGLHGPSISLSKGAAGVTSHLLVGSGICCLPP